MAEKIINVKLKTASDTQANWESKNTTLLDGELAYDKTKKNLKIGDGTTTWNNLPYLIPEVDAEYLIVEDIDVLPENPRQDTLYRLFEVEGRYNGYTQTNTTVHIVETLPETGESCTTDGSDFTVMYYNKADNAVYGYVIAEIGAAFGIPAGWYDAGTLLGVANITYGGVVDSIDKATTEDTYYFVQAYSLYMYTTEWISLDPIGWADSGEGSTKFNSPSNIASGAYSHAEGSDTTASGDYSHAEGTGTTASDSCSHAEGNSTTASDAYSHAEGSNTTASGYASHAEGEGTTASGSRSHAEGSYTTASGGSSHAEGSGTTASGHYSHAEGSLTTVTDDATITATTTSEITPGKYGHAEGYGTVAYGNSAHAEGNGTTASGSYSHAEGSRTTASGSRAHAEGDRTTASGLGSHTEGVVTTASSDYSHAEGSLTTVTDDATITATTTSEITRGKCGHAEGYGTVAYGHSAHAEGNGTTASGSYSHAEGSRTTASGSRAHAEGYNTTASGDNSHTEGSETTASSYGSHAEGYNTTASGAYSHAEGSNTTASSYASHAEGSLTAASGSYSHAEGLYTTASSDYQHAQGKYNIEDANNEYAHIVGNGTADDARSNAHTLDWNGNAWFAGDVYVGGNSQSEGKKLATEDMHIENLDELPTPTAVPDSGEVGTIYFNTSLKQEEVNKILDSLEYLVIEGTEAPIAPIVVNEDMTQGLFIQRGVAYTDWYGGILSAYRIIYADNVNGINEMIYGSILVDGVIRYDIVEDITDGTPNGWGLSEITTIDFSNALSALAPQFNYTSQNEKVKNLISTTPFDNELNKIYRVPHKVENEFGSEVDYYNYYGYQNGRKKIGLVKNEEANPLEVIDTKELENPLIIIEPKFVPNIGYIDKIYFNTKLSVTKVKQIVNELTWIDASNIGQSDFSFYPVLGYMNGDYPYVLAFKKYTDGNINLGIINFATMDNPQNFYVDAYGGWIQFDNPYSIGFEALSELSGISIGTENDKLINLIALTPFEQSRENPNVKKDAIYRTSTQQKELVYKGTPVPTTGEVSKIYFNTNLSTLEVTRILERITYDGTSDFSTYCVISSGDGRGLYILAQKGVYLMLFTESSIDDGIIYFSSVTLPDDSEDGVHVYAGWQGISELDFNGTNSDTEVGLQNDLLSSLISVTPFEQVEQEVPNTVDNYDYYRVKDGKWDKIFESLIEDVKELPAPLLGEAVTVPNTGYVEKVYFNTGMSIEEVGMIISTLTFDATLPAIGVLAGQNTALMIMSMGGQMAIQDFVTQEFYWVNEQIASILGVSAGWQKGSILEVNSEVSSTFDVELEGQTITVNVGEQNEAIKSLISLTPYFEDVENPEVRKDKIYRVAVPKKGLVMKGTPVPVGEYVEKIYFNTFLSKNKFREIVDKVRKNNVGDYGVFGANNGATVGIMNINNNSGYAIIVGTADGSVDGIREYIYSTDKMTGITPTPPVGYFSISECEVNSINEVNGIDTGMGIDNELLSEIFSITPFKPVIDYLPNTVDHYEYYRLCNGKWDKISESLIEGLEDLPVVIEIIKDSNNNYIITDEIWNKAVENEVVVFKTFENSSDGTLKLTGYALKNSYMTSGDVSYITALSNSAFGIGMLGIMKQSDGTYGANDSTYDGIDAITSISIASGQLAITYNTFFENADQTVYGVNVDTETATDSDNLITSKAVRSYIVEYMSTNYGNGNEEEF